MNISAFVEELLTALASLEAVERVTVQTEGPIAKGRAYLTGEMFLNIYYNQATGTQAFALVKEKERVWGIDYDNIRGWHLHPANAPDEHVAIESQSLLEVVEQLKQVL